MSIGSPQAHRFTEDDGRLLAIIAAQIGVAVQNARLHSYMLQGKQQWEATFDAIGDPIAVFDARGRLLRGNTALAAHLNRAVTTMRDLTCDEVGLCGGTYPDCAVGHAARTSCERAEVTLPDERIYSVTTCPVAGGSDGAAVVQIAKNVTLEIGDGTPAATHERRARGHQRAAPGHRRPSEDHSGAAASGGEAVGDRPTRCRAWRTS